MGVWATPTRLPYKAVGGCRPWTAAAKVTRRREARGCDNLHIVSNNTDNDTRGRRQQQQEAGRYILVVVATTIRVEKQSLLHGITAGAEGLTRLAIPFH